MAEHGRRSPRIKKHGRLKPKYLMAASMPQLSSVKTGICYDNRMRTHNTISVRDHHPEQPARISVIFNALIKEGLIFEDKDSDYMTWIPSRNATAEEILLAHDANHLSDMFATEKMSDEQLVTLENVSDSLYFNTMTAQCALLSCGSTIETAMAVARGEIKNAFAIVRPPGHHAEPTFPSGFCIFNNVAVATKCVQETCPEIKKILIFDWDVHHGNGTQRIFYNSSDVLYVSIHRYEDANFYPGTTFGNLDMCGEEDGLGYSVNIPWPRAQMGDGDYIYAFHKLILPIAYEFDPDMVIISAGFDAGEGDIIGECSVSASCYAHMTNSLMSLAGGKLLVVLEGGYTLETLERSGLAVAKALIGQKLERLGQLTPSEDAVMCVQKCMNIQSHFWDCLKPKFYDGGQRYSISLEQILQGHKRRDYDNKFQMLPFDLLLRGTLSDCYSAMATPNVFDCENLLVIVRPQAVVYMSSDGLENRADLSKTMLYDPFEVFFEWAKEKDIDILNVELLSNFPLDRKSSMIQFFQHIWDEILVEFSTKKIIFITAEQTVVGPTSLACTRDIRQRVASVLGFISKYSVPLVSHSVVVNSARWYYEHSLICVSEQNKVWGLDEKRLSSKKRGCMMKTDGENIIQIVAKNVSKGIEMIESMI